MNIEAIDFLNQLNEYGKIDYADYSHLHDLLTSEEPQDEPSGATLGIMAQRFYEASGLSIPHTAKPEVVAGLRAALRAAWEVR